MANDDGWTALHYSARNGSYESVTLIAAMGIDINLETKNGRNCLHIAALYGHLNLCKTLIDKSNFNVQMTDRDGYTALHYSARKGCYDSIKFFTDIGTDIKLKTNNGMNCLHIAAHHDHLNLCKILINKNYFDGQISANDGCTALHYFAINGRYELIKFLADMGADINLKNNLGLNCLHIAALYGHLNLCKELINKHNTDVKIGDLGGSTALHYSAKNGSYELINFFADMGTDINLKTKNGLNCLHIAADSGHLNLCKTLIDRHNFDVNMGDNSGSTALHFSAKSGSYELIKYFSDAGTDISLKNNLGFNCLHIATIHGHLDLCKTLIDKHNFNVQIADNYGYTALHHSAEKGNHELIKLLVDMRTDINLKTSDGSNCLHIAAGSGHLSLCITLINKYNFDVQMPNNFGWTPLHFSTKSGNYELVNFFANLGTDLNLKTKNGRNCLHIASCYGHLNLCKTLVTKHNFDVQLTDNEGFTVFHFSAKIGSYELVKFFADIGGDIHLKTNDGFNCLHIAADSGHFNLCKALIKKHNVDGQTTNNEGQTALHYSARSGSYELFKLFIDMGTDVNLKMIDGLNCLHIAADSGHLNLCKKLINTHEIDAQTADNEGYTALHYSIKNGSYELINFFMDIGTDINLKTKNGNNCLHIAADAGHVNLCKILIHEHNFDAQYADNSGWTALHHSAKNGSYELVRFFTDLGTDINLKTNNGNNCLHIAASFGHLNLCKALINKYTFNVKMGDNDGSTALHCSEKSGSYELVRYFADTGTDINFKNNLGLNCLHIATIHGHLDLCKALIDKHNFNIQMADNYGYNALHRSVENGRYELIKYFVDMGTNINLKTNVGNNCLHIAAKFGHLSLCKTLIDKHNFDVKTGNNDGYTALHYSAINGSYELFEFFANMGSNINLKVNDGLNCLHIAADSGHLNLCKKLINKYNIDVKVADNGEWTAFHYAARNGSHELLKHFADMGTDIKVKTAEGMNCLHIAAYFAHWSLCKTLIDKYNFKVQMAANNGWTPLHYSAKNGSYESVKYFSDMGTDIKLKTNDGISCLHIAADYGHLNLCKTLIKKYNFDVQMTNDEGYTALHCSARNGSYEVFNFLADMGADINIKTIDGINCLHIAADSGHLNLCKKLINKHKFDAQMANNDGFTALHYSAKSGSYDLLKYFADSGTDINCTNNEGLNCLHSAALYGHFDLCKTLIDKHNFNVQLTSNKGITGLHFSASNGSYELVQLFVNMGTDIKLKTIDGRNCLHIAAVSGHLNLCKTLINKHNIDVQLTDNDGCTALHYSAKNGSYELVKFFADVGTDINLEANDGTNCLHIAARYGHLNLCKTLIDKHNFNSEMATKEGWTALHYSAKNGSYELVKFFADMGTDINLKTNVGNNCLHIAANSGHLELCKTLVNKHKFDVTISDNNGGTALHFSAISGSYELVRYFADMGIQINLKTNEGVNCLHIAAFNRHLNLCKTLINKHSFDVQMADNNGWTALHYSAKKGSYELVRLFVEKGTDIDLKTNDGSNCLHIASHYGHLNLCKIFVDKHNFDVHMANTVGWTALHFSAKSGNFDLFSYILDKETEIYGKTNNMENVLHLSAREGHFDICKFILEYFIKDYEDKSIKRKFALNGKSYRSQVFYKYKIIFLHAMDVDGNTYLHLAAKGNQTNVCQLLLKYDTEIISLLNKEDKTAREIAKDNGHKEVSNALKVEYERAGLFFENITFY